MAELYGLVAMDKVVTLCLQQCRSTEAEAVQW